MTEPTPRHISPEDMADLRELDLQARELAAVRRWVIGKLRLRYSLGERDRIGIDGEIIPELPVAPAAPPAS